MWLVVNDQLRLMYIAVAGRQMQNSMSMLYAYSVGKHETLSV